MEVEAVGAVLVGDRLVRLARVAWFRIGVATEV
jgi:hypothetical protein